MTKIILFLLFTICSFTTFNSQNINLDEYEVYIGDTLVAKYLVILLKKNVQKSFNLNL